MRLVLSWLAQRCGAAVAAWIVPGVDVESFGDALVAALLIGILNAVLPPIVAALRLPFMALLGFVLVLVLDALMLHLASEIRPEAISVDHFGWALLAALVGGREVVLDVIFGTNDDDTYTLKVVQRSRSARAARRTDVPGIVYLEIDGLALPVLRRAMRDGNAPNMARWMAEGSYALTAWEPDLSSQTGASQAGILLGSNHDIPAFRWVDKPTGRIIACSGPDDCAEIERERATGIGLLTNGGSSRGNLLSGEADEVILTVSRISEEKKSNPGYRAFFANGFNVTRSLVLFFWEIVLEVMAACAPPAGTSAPRGHRSGIYPLLRATMCVVVRDLIVYGVLTDMMRGRPAIYATFSSYDEVAHHSGLERADTLEALRKLDQQFGRIDNARRYAPRPYEIVVLSDHGQTQGATFKQRNGYGLDELVERSLDGEGVQGRRRRAGFDGRPRRRGATGTGEAAGRRRSPRSASARSSCSAPATSASLPHGRAAAPHARRDRGAAPAAAAGAPRASSRRLDPRALARARGGRTRRRRYPLPRAGPGRRRRPARAVRAQRTAPPTSHGRLPACRRPHDRQLLRPRSRRRLCVRGADLVPRRARRPADPAVHPPPRVARGPRRGDRRRRAGARGAVGWRRALEGASAVIVRPPSHTAQSIEGGRVASKAAGQAGWRSPAC